MPSGYEMPRPGAVPNDGGGACRVGCFLGRQAAIPGEKERLTTQNTCVMKKKTGRRMDPGWVSLFWERVCATQNFSTDSSGIPFSVSVSISLRSF